MYASRAALMVVGVNLVAVWAAAAAGSHTAAPSEAAAPAQVVAEAAVSEASASLYVGEAMHILEMIRPRTGLLAVLREHWNRFLLHDLLPAGVVSGPANLFPREWRRAWQVASAGDVERMDELAALFGAFSASYRFASGKRSLAALKRGLLRRGVLSSDAVARGTAAFAADEAARFDDALERLCQGFAKALPARWCSDPECAEEP